MNNQLQSILEFATKMLEVDSSTTAEERKLFIKIQKQNFLEKFDKDDWTTCLELYKELRSACE